MTASRIQRRRVKGWRKPEGAVIVDRTSRWGNPFPISAYSDQPDPRDACLADYQRWINGDPDLPDVYVNGQAFDRRWVRDHVHELADQVVACACPVDQPCHGDILLTLAAGGPS